MIVTIQQGSRAAVTGVMPKPVITTTAILPVPEPEPPRILPGDRTTGPFGGLLFNCAPRELVGSVMFSAVGPLRRVRRADCSELGPVVGIIVSKPQDTVCEIIHAGYAPCFKNLVPGLRYYLGTRGTLVTLPLGDAIMPYVHYVGYATGADTLCVCPTYPLVKRARDGSAPLNP